MGIRAYLVAEVTGKSAFNVTHLPNIVYKWLWNNDKMYMHRASGKVMPGEIDDFMNDGRVGLIKLTVEDVEVIDVECTEAAKSEDVKDAVKRFVREVLEEMELIDGSGKTIDGITTPGEYCFACS